MPFQKFQKVGQEQAGLPQQKRLGKEIGDQAWKETELLKRLLCETLPVIFTCPKAERETLKFVHFSWRTLVRHEKWTSAKFYCRKTCFNFAV